jgi:hypothetical protein
VRLADLVNARILVIVRWLAVSLCLACALSTWGCSPSGPESEGFAESAQAARPAGPTTLPQWAGRNSSALAPADATAPETLGSHLSSARRAGAGGDNAVPQPSPPRIQFEPAIGVTTMRLVRHEKPQTESLNDSMPAACAVQLLHEKPAASARPVATFKIDGMPSQRDDITAVLKGKACEAGANALLIEDSSQKDSETGSVYHIEAVAFFIEKSKTAADASPVPRTITVPLPAPAVPKTITVDSGAGR